MLWKRTRLLCFNVDGVLVDWHQFFGWIGSAKACPTHWCQAHTRSHKGGEKKRESKRHVSWQREWAIWFNRINYQSHNRIECSGKWSCPFYFAAHFPAVQSPKSFRNQWIVLNGPQRSMRSPINIYSIQFNALGALFLCCVRPGAVFVWMNLIWSLCLCVCLCIRRDFIGTYATFHSLRFALKSVHTDRNEKKTNGNCTKGIRKWCLAAAVADVTFARYEYRIRNSSCANLINSRLTELPNISTAHLLDIVFCGRCSGHIRIEQKGNFNWPFELKMHSMTSAKLLRPCIVVRSSNQVDSVRVSRRQWFIFLFILVGNLKLSVTCRRWALTPWSHKSNAFLIQFSTSSTYFKINDPSNVDRWEA